jgi:hypothetical protein
MKSYSRSHLADSTLLRSLAASTTRVCEAIADQLADIGEVDERKLPLRKPLSRRRPNIPRGMLRLLQPSDRLPRCS